jgi:hypothetical protein
MQCVIYTNLLRNRYSFWFSFQVLVQYRSMEIKGENVGVDLKVGLIKVTKSTFSCPDRGQSLNQRAVGPTASAYIMATRTKVCCGRIQYTYTGVRSLRALQRWDAPLPTIDPFFHDAGAASGSRSSSTPTIWIAFISDGFFWLQIKLMTLLVRTLRDPNLQFAIRLHLELHSFRSPS